MSRAIIVDILGNSKGFTTATQEATGAASKFQNVLQGIGQGIGQAGFQAVSQAISGVTDWLTGSLAAAQKNELSMAQLGQTLKENVPNWDGNSTAIENYITSAEKASAFSKDDLRSSLNLLVGATHDVTKAENDQTIATNLARYKNMDLQSATQLVVDVEAGRYKGLVQLGINTKGLTSSTQALAEVMDKVGGQDTSYLGTEAGQMQELTNQIDDLQVELGQKLMPVFKQVLTFLNNNFIPGVQALSGVWDGFLNTITLGASHTLAAYNAYQASLPHEGEGKLPKIIGKDVDDTSVAFGLMVGTIRAGGAATLKAIQTYSTDVSDGWDALGETAVTKIETIGRRIRTVATGAFTTSLNLDPLIIPDSARLKALYAQLATVEGNRDRAIKAHDTVTTEADSATIAKLTAEINALVHATDSNYGNGKTKMASGGIVKANPGGTGVILGEAGEDEFVIPRSKMGGFTLHVHIDRGALISGPAIDTLTDLIFQRIRLRGLG